MGGGRRGGGGVVAGLRMGNKFACPSAAWKKLIADSSSCLGYNRGINISNLRPTSSAGCLIEHRTWPIRRGVPDALAFS